MDNRNNPVTNIEPLFQKPVTSSLTNSLHAFMNTIRDTITMLFRHWHDLIYGIEGISRVQQNSNVLSFAQFSNSDKRSLWVASISHSKTRLASHD